VRGVASKKERVAIVSVVASGTLATAKFVVGVAIGSLALISDALHSLIDLGATLVTWFAVRVADRPPDAEHHYGHGKVESVAALAASALLCLVAGGVAVEAVQRLRAGGTLIAFTIVPFVVLGVEMAINAWRARALMRVARETRSEALEADSLHFASDFFGSIPVIIGLLLSAGGYSWGDPAAALVVAVLIAALGFRMARRTIGTLVDTAPEGVADEAAAEIRKVAGVVGIDRVRVRMVGPRHFIDAAVRLPRTFPSDQVALVRTRVQQAVTRLFDDADVTVTTTPVALDNETVLDRIMVIARNRALAVHHVTLHELKDRLAVALDLEVDGKLSLQAAHETADRLEEAIAAELGPGVEVETHIEPLQPKEAQGREAPPERVRAVQIALAELAAQTRTIRDVHNVRVRETDDGEIVNFHCRVDPSLAVQAVHEKVDALERALRERAPSIKRVIGHAEPTRP
jgi:cation diffusion facilitator family transporter